MLIFRTY